MEYSDPLEFTALDDGQGGIELKIDVEPVFRALPADIRAERYLEWQGELRLRIRELAPDSDERTGLGLLLAVAEAVEEWMSAATPPPATLSLSVSAAGAEQETSAPPMPPTKH